MYFCLADKSYAFKKCLKETQTLLLKCGPVHVYLEVSPTNFNLSSSQAKCVEDSIFSALICEFLEDSQQGSTLYIKAIYNALKFKTTKALINELQSHKVTAAEE